MRIYKDKHGKEIKAGMTIRHDDGDIEKVYECGDKDFGVSASNPDFHHNHPDSELGWEYYPLHQFNLKEWEIIVEEDKE